ncbi:MAG: hypothetical protein LUG51_00150 [Tannerellaceae bacterium]|nr:hypothetical protein [Tannerellaceae bacterium]
MQKRVSTILILLTISLGIKAQYLIDTPYEYPVRPGSDEWAAFTTGQQMVDACQIPTDILSKLTTKALAETCMNYPLFFQYTASNDERDGIAYMINSFNGLKELSNRKDGVIELMNIYQEMPLEPAVLSRSLHGNKTILHVGYVELLLSNEEFFQHLSSQQDLDKLKKITLEKYQGKVANRDAYSLFGLQKSLLLGAKVLEKQIIKENHLLNNKRLRISSKLMLIQNLSCLLKYRK